MYVIIDNKPFAVRGDKLYEVSFGDRGTIVIGKEVDKEVEGKIYTYDEISRKFNLKLLLQKKDEQPKKVEKPVKEEKTSIKEVIEEPEKEVIEEVKIEDNKKNK
jgi:hypothetical protein